MLLTSPYKEIEIPEVGMHQALMAAMSVFEDRTALINGLTDEKYTYSQVIEYSRNVASGLHRLGVRKGDILSIYCPNAPEYAFMFLGTWINGASITVTNPTYTEYELLHHLEDSQANWLFTSSEQLPKVRKACEKYKNIKRTITLDAADGCVSVNQLMQDDGSQYPDDVEINPKEDVALIPYSSGTTGLPKGVMLTHYNLIANLMQMGHEEVREAREEGSPTPIVLNVLPMFHMYAIEGLLLGGLISGITLICLPRFDPHKFLGAIQKYKVNVLPLVPPLVVFLTKSPLTSQYDLSSIEKAISGAAPLKASTAQAFLKKLNLEEDFTNGYGMTETTCGATLPGLKTAKPGSVGRILANMEVKIVDPATGKMLAQGERGEICMRGPNIMKGYHNKPEATRNTLDSDGFLHSGDVGYYDEDGYIFVVDRMKELIKYKGFQVAPAELEALLLSHPDVDDVGVIGIPDEEAGEVPRAYVVQRPSSSVTAHELDAFVNERLSSFKRLRGGIVFIDQVPKTPTGKIMRRRLLEKYKAEKEGKGSRL